MNILSFLKMDITFIASSFNGSIIKIYTSIFSSHSIWINIHRQSRQFPRLYMQSLFAFRLIDTCKANYQFRVVLMNSFWLSPTQLIITTTNLSCAFIKHQIWFLCGSTWEEHKLLVRIKPTCSLCDIRVLCWEYITRPLVDINYLVIKNLLYINYSCREISLDASYLFVRTISIKN